MERRVRAVLGTERELNPVHAAEPTHPTELAQLSRPTQLSQATQPAQPARPTRPTRHRAPNPVARLLAQRGAHLDASRSAAVSAAAAVVVIGVLAVWWVMSARPQAASVQAASAVPVAAPTVGASAAAGTSSAVSAEVSPPADVATSRAGQAAIVVDVAGKVRRPGLYRMGPGARVDDAVRAAGGALPGVDLAGLNLAALLVDGQQVAVGVAAAPAAGGVTGGGMSPGATAGPVHLNSATLEQLQALPGVGPVLAQHIVDFRSAHGGFTSVAQLNDVPGIGDAKFAALKASVSL